MIHSYFLFFHLAVCTSREKCRSGILRPAHQLFRVQSWGRVTHIHVQEMDEKVRGPVSNYKILKQVNQKEMDDKVGTVFVTIKSPSKSVERRKKTLSSVSAHGQLALLFKDRWWDRNIMVERPAESSSSPPRSWKQTENEEQGPWLDLPFEGSPFCEWPAAF